MKLDEAQRLAVISSMLIYSLRYVLLESGLKLAEEKSAQGKAGTAISTFWKAASIWPVPSSRPKRRKAAPREGLAVRRPRHDLGPRPHAGRQQRRRFARQARRRRFGREHQRQKLDNDNLVLGGSGTGSDISIGGDSGIWLVDPKDSGLSLEAPLNLSSGEESLELGEDDLLGSVASFSFILLPSWIVG